MILIDSALAVSFVDNLVPSFGGVFDLLDADDIAFGVGFSPRFNTPNITGRVVFSILNEEDRQILQAKSVSVPQPEKTVSCGK